jgi:hypothetical protein
VSLSAPATERAIRRRVRRTLKETPSLWKESKRNRRSVRRQSDVSSFLLVLLGVFGPLVLVSVTLAGDSGGQWTLWVLTAYATGLPCFWASRLATGLYSSPEVAMSLFLPLSGQEILRIYLRRGLLWSLPVLVGLVPAYGVWLSDEMHHGRPGLIIALGFALLQWFTALAGGALLVRHWPRGRHLAMGLVSWIVALACLFGVQHLPASGLRAAGWALASLPAGWVNLAFHEGILGGTANALLLIVPAVAFCILLVPALLSLRRTYSTEELAQPDGLTAEVIVEHAIGEALQKEREEDPYLQSVPELERAKSHEFRRDIEASMEAHVLTREFLRYGEAEWKGGPIERAAWWLLNRRERVIAEFMMGQPARWSRWWLYAAAGSVGGIVATRLSPDSVAPYLSIATLFAASLAAPWAGGEWPGFSKFHCAGKHIPLHAIYPLGYHEVGRVMLKANLIRCAAWLPLVMGVVAWLATRMDSDPATGAVFGVTVAFALATLQPIVAATRFLQGTDATSRLTLVSTSFVFLVAMPLFLLWVAAIGLTFAGAMAYGKATAVVSGVAAVVLSSCFYFAVGAFHDRAGADQISTTQE